MRFQYVWDKDTKSRAQCQIYLSIAEREYLRRSQRYENFLLAPRLNGVPYAMDCFGV